MKQLLEVTDMCRSRLPAVFLDVLNLMLGNIPYSLGGWGGGVGGRLLLGIVGVGVLCSFPDPDPISDQKMSFSTPVFRPDPKSISNLHIYLSFFETINTSTHSHSSLENHTWFQTKMGKIYLYLFSDQKGLRTLPLGVAHTYMAYVREYPPPPPSLIYDTFHLCARLRTDGLKMMPCGYSGSK